MIFIKHVFLQCLKKQVLVSGITQMIPIPVLYVLFICDFYDFFN